jgi:hypothetical protein
LFNLFATIIFSLLKQIIVEVLGYDEFLVFLRQIEKEVDNQAVPLLTDFRKKK